MHNRIRNIIGFTIALTILLGTLLYMDYVFGEEKKPEPVKYKLTMEVTFNAVTAEEIPAILKSMEKACEISSKIEKVNPSTNITAGSGIMFMPVEQNTEAEGTMRWHKIEQ